jgi:hypothetical protein
MRNLSLLLDEQIIWKFDIDPEVYMIHYYQGSGTFYSNHFL